MPTTAELKAVQAKVDEAYTAILGITGKSENLKSAFLSIAAAKQSIDDEITASEVQIVDYLWWEHVEVKGTAYTLYWRGVDGYFIGVLRDDSAERNVSNQALFSLEALQRWAVSRSVELGGYLCKATDEAIPFAKEVAA